ncbi:MAG: hypothetical protein M3Q72_01685, partial [Actinomycetota bacterium]|nr:hypothetical protein [Actinomycetota bacterium]
MADRRPLVVLTAVVATVTIAALPRSTDSAGDPDDFTLTLVDQSYSVLAGDDLRFALTLAGPVPADVLPTTTTTTTTTTT